jgi:hypothetical protein
LSLGGPRCSLKQPPIARSTLEADPRLSPPPPQQPEKSHRAPAAGLHRAVALAPAVIEINARIPWHRVVVSERPLSGMNQSHAYRSSPLSITPLRALPQCPISASGCRSAPRPGWRGKGPAGRIDQCRTNAERAVLRAAPGKSGLYRSANDVTVRACWRPRPRRQIPRDTMTGGRQCRSRNIPPPSGTCLSCPFRVNTRRVSRLGQARK